MPLRRFLPIVHTLVISLHRLARVAPRHDMIRSLLIFNSYWYNRPILLLISLLVNSFPRWLGLTD